jgi:hypothetical protein
MRMRMRWWWRNKGVRQEAQRNDAADEDEEAEEEADEDLWRGKRGRQTCILARVDQTPQQDQTPPR